MHCNGRCYLMNKVKQAVENEKKQANKDFRTAMQVVWHIQPQNLIDQAPAIDALSRSFKINYRSTFYNSYNASIFRPPKPANIA